ncbi:MAG: hypothetical protein JW940_27765 [Polyangiaceae bacterium]|nr:hypothetical protein [Polyangiaceae bacterium]
MNSEPCSAGLDAPWILREAAVAFEFKAFLKALLAQAQTLVPAKKASAFLFDPASSRLRLEQATEDLEGFELAPGQGIAGRALDCPEGKILVEDRFAIIVQGAAEEAARPGWLPVDPGCLADRSLLFKSAFLWSWQAERVKTAQGGTMGPKT